jgi:DNA processing protein
VSSEQQQIEYWLALARAPGVGPVKFAQLLKRFQTPHGVFAAFHYDLINFGLKPPLIEYLQHPDWDAVKQDLAWLQGANNHLLTLDHPYYPIHLRQIHDPPPLLFAHGDFRLLSQAPLAIVGTRNPSPQGELTARQFAEALSHAGFTIVSGLAVGIDAACHEGALAGSGHTIAVAGTGLDRVYPAQHLQLAYKIAQKGVLISEFPPGTPPAAINFPRRNRIISGISVGTLVVEAAIKSGSLITARCAAEQGRDVFAIPGALSNPRAKGCHALIKEGAKLVETPDDIIEDLLIHLPSTAPPREPAEIKAIMPTTSPPSSAAPVLPEMNAEYTNLLKYIDTETTSIDKLVDMSGLTAEAISSMLLILELEGMIKTVSGGLYMRIK